MEAFDSFDEFEVKKEVVLEETPALVEAEPEEVPAKPKRRGRKAKAVDMEETADFVEPVEAGMVKE